MVYLNIKLNDLMPRLLNQHWIYKPLKHCKKVYKSSLILE